MTMNTNEELFVGKTDANASYPDADPADTYGTRCEIEGHFSVFRFSAYI